MGVVSGRVSGCDTHGQVMCTTVMGTQPGLLSVLTLHASPAPPRGVLSLLMCRSV
jgi:hypothetical protein